MLMSPGEQQPRPRALRLMRWSYGASMALGFPLWFLGCSAFCLLAYIAALGGLNEKEQGLSELTKPSEILGVVSLAAYVCIYLHIFLTVHRRSKRLWLPFGLLAAPVAILTALMVASLRAEASTSTYWMVAYMSLLLALLIGGLIMAAATEKSFRDTTMSTDS